jgi:hypothetical protein
MITRRFKASPVKVQGVSANDVPFESSLEQDYLVLLRFRRGEIEHVERVTEEIPWFDQGGGRRSYKPDFKITFRLVRKSSHQAVLLSEVKPEFDDDPFNPRSRLPFDETDDERRMKWAAAINFAKVRGWDFEVAWESQIRTPLLQNAKFLIRTLETPSRDMGSKRILDTLKRQGPTTLGDLMHQLEPEELSRAQLLPTLYHCIASKRIAADLDQLLSVKTVLKVPS